MGYVHDGAQVRRVWSRSRRKRTNSCANPMQVVQKIAWVETEARLCAVLIGDIGYVSARVLSGRGNDGEALSAALRRATAMIGNMKNRGAKVLIVGGDFNTAPGASEDGITGPHAIKMKDVWKPRWTRVRAWLLEHHLSTDTDEPWTWAPKGKPKRG